MKAPGPHALTGWSEHCLSCGREWGIQDGRWRCACGGALALSGPQAGPGGGAAPGAQPTSPTWSIWRYRDCLPGGGDGGPWQEVSMGEGMTPLVAAGGGRYLKLDFLMPTLSFKDRGSSVMLTVARALGVQRVVADSSGNLGASVAAYAARADLEALVFVPEGVKDHKLAAIRTYGAEVRLVPGGRSAAARAAEQAASSAGAWYASHVHQPAFAHGVKTLAFELWEQLGGSAPSAVVVPAGNGTLVLGLALGLAELEQAGKCRSGTAIFAVQAERCAPLAGREPTGPTAADGIAVPDPPRREEVVAAVRASGGRVVTVSEEAIAAASSDLARRGLWVEPSAAAAWAARYEVAPPGEGPLVTVLTGAGLKSGAPSH